MPRIHHKSALIAMSGGVDSTVAAVLTQNCGIDCAGAMMKLYPERDDFDSDARAVAGRLGIPFFVFDFSECFAGQVIKPFIDAYRGGRTPNPCINCNKHLKFGCLLEKAHELGRDSLVTGHYARVEHSGDGRYLLKKSEDVSKDQSYVLYLLTQEQLSHTRFPLGGLTKSEVREIAQNAGLQTAHKKESQDICFIPDGDYAKFIADRTGETPRKGRFIDSSGADLGENRGIIGYTIGQRRGLGLAMPYPPYVIDILPESDAVVVGGDEMLYSKTLYARDINLIPIDKLNAPLKARVKIRYKHREQPATVCQTSDDSLRIEFDEPQRAITKGQAAVIYDGDIVIGGGTIF